MQHLEKLRRYLDLNQDRNGEDCIIGVTRDAITLNDLRQLYIDVTHKEIEPQRPRLVS